MRKISKAETIAIQTDNWLLASDQARGEKFTGLPDWHGLEHTLRAYIQTQKDERLDYILASFTRRLWELPCKKCGELSHMGEECNGKLGGVL